MSHLYKAGEIIQRKEVDKYIPEMLSAGILDVVYVLKC